MTIQLPLTPQEQERAMTAVVEAFGDALLVGYTPDEIFDTLRDHLLDWQLEVAWITEENRG